MQGIGAGATVTAGGWPTGSIVDATVEKGARSAVVSALAASCVDKVQAPSRGNSESAEGNELGQRAFFVETSRWGTMIGAAASEPVAARACAVSLGSLKL